MSFHCKLCLRVFDTSQQLVEHFDDHFLSQECGNCNQQLILINGEYYYLLLHLVSSCNVKTLVSGEDTTKAHVHAIPEEQLMLEGMEDKHVVNGNLTCDGKQLPRKAHSIDDAPEFLKDPKESTILIETKDSTFHYKLSYQSNEDVQDTAHYNIEYLDQEFESLDQSLEMDNASITYTMPVQQVQQEQKEHQEHQEKKVQQYTTTHLEIAPVVYAPFIPTVLPSHSSNTAASNDQQPKQYQCDICDRYYVSRQTLAAHMKAHSTTSDTKTKHVGKLKVQLAYHRNSHRGMWENRLIKCSYSKCEKVFETYGALMAHKRLHASEKPFKCSQNGCNQAFAHGVHLKRHLADQH